ncbi:hypothetical protein NDU88_005597 [Pleurodeles waltl]|uniref:Uncharacterized protein n=1 Tax=Pleurodeles waltl TaxID=8319 RepID=A0AAV7LLQ9_PLEWA|nr:hypothetical protein NDU88_005597 [Pleurodeles waltl]
MLLLRGRPVRSAGVPSRAIAVVSALQWGASLLPDPPRQAQRVPELTPVGGQEGRASSRQRAQCSPSRITPIQRARSVAGSQAPRTPARTSQAHPRLALQGAAGSERSAQLTSLGERPRCRGSHFRASWQHQSEGAPAWAQGDRINPTTLRPSKWCNQVEKPGRNDQSELGRQVRMLEDKQLDVCVKLREGSS